MYYIPLFKSFGKILQHSTHLYNFHARARYLINAFHDKNLKLKENIADMLNIYSAIHLY